MSNSPPPGSSRRAKTGYTGSIRSPSPRSSFGSRSTAAANNQALPLPPSRRRADPPPPPPATVDPSTPVVGSRVKVSHKQETLFGRVLYVGETHFSTRPGTVWAGIRLDEPKGNHDGEFKGERYFICESKHGLFQHLGNIKVIDNFEAPPAHSSPNLHSTSSLIRGAAALALSPSPMRPATASSSPRDTSTRPQVLSPSTHRSAPPPPFSTTTSSMLRRSTALPPAATTHTSTSPSTNSSTTTSRSIMSLAMPSTNYNPTPPANFTTAESASTTASNNDDLLGGMILEQILHSQEVHDKLAAMMSEEVGRQVNERLKQVRDDTTILKDQVSRETSFMSTFVAGGIQRIEDKIAELKDSITASAAAATGSSQAQQEMEEQKLALAAIMEVASATKWQLQEEVKQRTEAISQLRIMSEDEGNP